MPGTIVETTMDNSKTHYFLVTSITLIALAACKPSAGPAPIETETPPAPPETKAATIVGDPNLPFEITEQRDRCTNYVSERQALFGSTHLHTGLSFDASVYLVDFGSSPEDPKGNNPRSAYAFAKGGSKIHMPQPSGVQRCGAPASGVGPERCPEIDYPLDWGAVTDHAELFGTMGLCKGFVGDEVPEYHSMECRMLNGFFYEPGEASGQAFGTTMGGSSFTQLAVSSIVAISRNTRLPVCENNPELCDKAEVEVWSEVQRAAEEAYDRSADCSFTSFIAYENSSSPLGNTWHRNVIFRNDRVVDRPVTAIDMAVEPNPNPQMDPINTIAGVVETDAQLERVNPVPRGVYNHPLPEPFWNKLESKCSDGEAVTPGLDLNCDFITIPHNTNLGGGSGLFPPSFFDPFNTQDAQRRQDMEPLVEIYQVKGASECRYDPRFSKSENTSTDEYCSFEILDSSQGSNVAGQPQGSGPAAPDTYRPRSYVRNIWEDGIEFAAKGTYDGVNPFKMGVVAGSDAHSGAMGWHPENSKWPGHSGIHDSFPMSKASSIQYSTGGFSVVWAEENSRDSIFSALARKEAYGTSGTRITARFFGGWDLPKDACTRDLAKIGYEQGVPMGGDLPPNSSGADAPSFMVAAWRDDNIQTKLQQIQIIKASVGSNGEVDEKVYTVAGDDRSQPRDVIDPLTCKPKPKYGSESLCQVWEDPDFDPDDHAFYYVRVLEEPVCRYSTLWCRDYIGVDPLVEDECKRDLEKMGEGSPEEQRKAEKGAMCCSNEHTDTFVQPIIQERAWTSPIWYEPAPLPEPAPASGGSSQ